jgi:predicted MPP superfamily phosphohydrolase
MLLDGFILAATALGHFCLVVLAINVVHGIGFSPRAMRRVARTQFLALAGVTAALAWVAWQGGWRDWPWPARGYAVACLAAALVGLPATTIARRLGRPPRGISGRAEEIDLTEAFGAGSLIGDGRRAWWLRLPGNGSLRLRLEQWSVEVDGLPASCEGLSLVHLSDLHFDPSYRRRFFEAVADEAGRWEADLVVFTGDLFDDDATLDWVVPVLSRVRGRWGQFAILGNHDYRRDYRRAAEELGRAGFTVLDGRWIRLELDGATLALGGTSAPWGPDLDPAGMPEADLRIVLSHTPDRFYRLASLGVDLVLAGHNHGGQYRLPIVGPVLMPSVYSRRFDRGFFRRGRTLMYVSQGIGAEHPLRIGCPPEIARLVLRAARPSPDASSRTGDRRRVESLQSADEAS